MMAPPFSCGISSVTKITFHSFVPAALAGSALLLVSACANFAPSLTGESPKGANATPAKASASVPAANLGSSNFEPKPVTAGSSTGTRIGQQVETYRAELESVRSQISSRNGSLQGLRAVASASAQKYHSAVGNIQARLQVGSTPGNPELEAQWNSAQAELETVNSQIGAMTNLANASAGDANATNFLLEKIRGTFALSGALEEDHRQLRVLEDETQQMIVLVERLLTEVSDDVARQNAFISVERANLQTLELAVKRGESYGTNLTSAARYAAASQLQQASPSIAPVAGRAPLVVIRFDRDDVPYEQALYTAVQNTLYKNPNAKFDLVQVVPSAGAPAKVAVAATRTKQYSDRVMRSLADMGLPAERISIQTRNAPSATYSEVLIYTR